MWSLRYGWDTESPNAVTRTAHAENPLPGNWVFELPVVQHTTPGIRAVLRLETRPWNERV
jgi:hypothetical protein